jgi:hypothetical protein
MIEWRGLVTCSNSDTSSYALKFSTVGPDHDVRAYELTRYSLLNVFGSFLR